MTDDTPGPGHNSGVAADELRQIVERIERVSEEIEGLQGDRKDIYSEAKGRGFDAKAIRRLVRERKRDHAERQEENAILQTYAQALGMDIFG